MCRLIAVQCKVQCKSVDVDGPETHLLRLISSLRGCQGSLDDVIGLPGRRALPGRVFQTVIYELGYAQWALLWHLRIHIRQTQGTTCLKASVRACSWIQP